MEKLKLQLNEYLNVMVKRGAILGVVFGLLPAALFFYAGYTFLIEPGLIENDAKTVIVKGLEAQVANGRAVEAGQEEFKKKFKKIVALFSDSLPLLPAESEFSSVLTGIQQIAGRYRVTLTGLNAVRDGQKTANADKLIERELPATVVGNYDDVMRFFLDVSRQTRILIIRDYAVQSAVAKEKNARPSFVSVDFSLLAYHTPPSAEFPVVPPEFMPEAASFRGAASDSLNPANQSKTARENINVQ